MNGPLLELTNVRKYFSARRALPWSRAAPVLRAVDGVSFEVRDHQTVSLVGETGCGKTTTARLVLHLEEPTAGEISLRGANLSHLRGVALKRYRAAVQAVFQDPWSSLNPRMRVRDIVAEPLVINSQIRQREARERVAELFDAVGLDPVTASNFPHEFSGGQRQRIALARALVLSPALIVLDEPVSSLDVSVGAQVMNLLKDVQERYGIAYLLIAHNLATVRYLSQRIEVMYLGQIVESAPTSELFRRPLHPYTQALIAAALPSRPGDETSQVLGGEIPSPFDPPSGCRFRTRCPFAFERCSVEVPPLRELAPGHKAACHLY